jgi:hypothetical protein
MVAPRPSSAFDLPVRLHPTSNVRSSPLEGDTVCKARSSIADVLFKQGLVALMQPIICCVRTQSVREFVTEFSHTHRRCHAAPKRCGSELEL